MDALLKTTTLFAFVSIGVATTQIERSKNRTSEKDDKWKRVIYPECKMYNHEYEKEYLQYMLLPDADKLTRYVLSKHFAEKKIANAIPVLIRMICFEYLPPNKMPPYKDRQEQIEAETVALGEQWAVLQEKKYPYVTALSKYGELATIPLVNEYMRIYESDTHEDEFAKKRILDAINNGETTKLAFVYAYGLHESRLDVSKNCKVTESFLINLLLSNEKYASTLDKDMVKRIMSTNKHRMK
jgi:hypothetical protein